MEGTAGQRTAHSRCASITFSTPTSSRDSTSWRSSDESPLALWLGPVPVRMLPLCASIVAQVAGLASRREDRLRANVSTSVSDMPARFSTWPPSVKP